MVHPHNDEGGVPYWEHPVRVMHRLPDDATMNEKLAALLHDVIEDTGYTANDLRDMGYPDEVVNLIRRLTRPRLGETYHEWIAALAMRGDKSAIRIKIADNHDNIDPERLKTLPAERRKHFIKRYTESLRLLEGGE